MFYFLEFRQDTFEEGFSDMSWLRLTFFAKDLIKFAEKNVVETLNT